MIKDNEDKHTYLMTPEQAALDILYVLMLADGEADESEFDVIKDFLKSEFAMSGSLFNDKHPLYSGTNFAKEFAYLKTLDHKALKSRFLKAVGGFREWMADHPESEKVKTDIVKFSLQLIAADGKISAAEKERLDIIGKEWDIKIPY